MVTVMVDGEETTIDFLDVPVEAVSDVTQMTIDSQVRSLFSTPADVHSPDRLRWLLTMIAQHYA